MRELELLSPAADKEVARQAILHGADAVYMGGPSHGARKRASNSLEDIRETVEFAHRFRVRVYITVNTLVYENELKDVENLCWDLYRIGVDALIVQDMSLLRMNLPPIALHASTQCDTRTPEKARFLQDAGFSQIVLARELSLPEIREITDSVSVPVECFVHGALCVSYSGRCGASCLATGRSANRGECAQMCRLPYSLKNSKGEILEKDKYLLSLRDFNCIANLDGLVQAGVSSFKIEGRLKDAGYVKNVTAAYSSAIDRIIAGNPDKFRRTSFGCSDISFSPNLQKSFNRGFTDYFLEGRKNISMASLHTPKSMGEVISDPKELNNGDGISFFNSKGEYVGVGVNKVVDGKIIGSRKFFLPSDAVIHRTSDIKWQQLMSRETASRNLWIDIEVDSTGITANDERGLTVRVDMDADMQTARKPMNPEPVFSKLGNTVYRLRKFTNNLPEELFIPLSQLTALRRRLVDALDAANLSTYKFDYRREEKDVQYILDHTDARDNVANSMARKFYEDHGVKKFDKPYELASNLKNQRDKVVMTTRYCIRRELGCCLKDKSVSPQKKALFSAPLTLSTGPNTFRLDFDCARCEMNVIKI